MKRAVYLRCAPDAGVWENLECRGKEIQSVLPVTTHDFNPDMCRLISLKLNEFQKSALCILNFINGSTYNFHCSSDNTLFVRIFLTNVIYALLMRIERILTFLMKNWLWENLVVWSRCWNIIVGIDKSQLEAAKLDTTSSVCFQDLFPKGKWINMYSMCLCVMDFILCVSNSWKDCFAIFPP